MKLELSSPIRLGLQAATAVILAKLIGHYLNLDRAYWAVLTAVLLISQTWGDSIIKSFQRVIMTIAGGCAGTLLYYWVQSSPIAITSCLLLSVFFMVYFIEISYLTAIFFITLLVVFLFAELQGWSTRLLEDRIIQTFIGAIIAIVTSAIVFPIRAHDHSKEKLTDFLNHCSETLDYCFDFINQKNQTNTIALKNHYSQLMVQFNQLQQTFRASRYENLFSRAAYHQFQHLNLALGLIYHYLTSIIETAPLVTKCKKIDLLQTELAEMQKVLRHNLLFVQHTLSQDKINHAQLSWESIETLRFKVRKIIESNVKTSADKADWFDVYSFFYFLRRYYESLADLGNVTLTNKQQDMLQTQISLQNKVQNSNPT